LLYCSIFFIAAITGSLLPLLLKNTQETYTTRLLASTLDASDHLGAMCGALAAPFILLPIFGMYSIGILLLLSISLFVFKKWI
ncbi:MAG: spermidine synthase, partial [Spirochaetes bacterium]|nr:spermidine synthase [Spirochaetota bacterium]